MGYFGSQELIDEAESKLAKQLDIGALPNAGIEAI
jgi:hypothetical protein